eukprot:TRINITY_DN33238_c0_g1_i1.p1 TRINITY_DN33238_c0_g1~~TRINITY_DN33238_c0_g1_i1.p1  ORF type:complete len:353 (-),score=48.45 TRINITY_DN33238_c0_g1_i1:97-1026(-)
MQVPAMCYQYGIMISSQSLYKNGNREVVQQYSQAIAALYRDNPYHNFHHAFGVSQWKFAMFKKSKMLADALTDLQVHCLFTASLAHDAGHPGTNNAFQTATKSELAIRYNDQAVLEKHHAALGLRVMENSECDMFGDFSHQSRKDANELFTHAILMTDMAQHNLLTDQVKARKSRGIEAYTTTKEDQLELVGVVMHAADISNPLLPDFKACRKWAELITQEFISQYNMEKENGLPETKMWANLHTPLGFYASQVGFINFLVAPFWNSVLEIYQDLDSNAFLKQHLEDNKNTWAGLKAQEEANDEEAKTS